MKRTIKGAFRLIGLSYSPRLYFLSTLFSDFIDYLKRSRFSIDEKIEKAYASLRETSVLIGELERSVEQNKKRLLTLRELHERYSKLAKIEEEKAGALIQQVETSLLRLGKRERWISLVVNIGIAIGVFILGILLSPIIKTWLGIGG